MHQTTLQLSVILKATRERSQSLSTSEKQEIQQYLQREFQKNCTIHCPIEITLYFHETNPGIRVTSGYGLPRDPNTEVPGFWDIIHSAEKRFTLHADHK